jgi:hypothetical protein
LNSFKNPIIQYFIYISGAKIEVLFELAKKNYKI